VWWRARLPVLNDGDLHNGDVDDEDPDEDDEGFASD
jgi:hypothetical protein